MDNKTDDEDDTPDTDGQFPAQLVGERSTTEGTNQGTDGKQTDNETSTDVAEVVGAIRTEFTIALFVVIHLLEAGDLTSIVAEKKTTEGGENTHDESPEGEARNGSINPGHHGLLDGRLGLVNMGLRNRLAMVGGSFHTHDGEIN